MRIDVCSVYILKFSFDIECCRVKILVFNNLKSDLYHI